MADVGATTFDDVIECEAPPLTVVDSEFQVRGTEGLRVADLIAQAQ